jgi:6-phosphogluconolactonase
VNPPVDVRVFDDPRSLGEAAAAWMAGELAAAVAQRGRASFVLSGGSTPRIAYEPLASRVTDVVPWSGVHVFWGDERYVPPDHPNSNYRMAKETLLDAVDLPLRQIHPMPTCFEDPSQAADAYEAVLAGFFAGAPPAFDLMLLGIGEDGHIASVFAGSPALAATRAVMAVTAPIEPHSRLTLTLPVIASARRIGVLAAGAAKAPAVAAALVDRNGATPAALLARTAPTSVWWVDRAAWAEAARGAPA